MSHSHALAEFWLRPVWSPRRPIFGSPSLSSVFSRQFSVPSSAGLRSSDTCHSPHVTRHSRPRAAFTLIELLVVVALIAVLAGITIAALGGMNQRAARDRAKGEVAAIVSAIQSYHSQNGVYPPVLSGDKVSYVALAGFLGSARFETNSSGELLDPYGNTYGYRTNGVMKNPASFDVYSLGVDTNSTTGAADDIGNW